MNMTCPRCGQALPVGARFCTNCGQPLVATPAPSGPAMTQAAAVPAGWVAGYVPARKSRWPWIVGAFLAAVIAAFGLHKMGFLKLGGPEHDSTLQANGKAGNPILEAPGDNSVPMLKAPGDSPPPILQAPSATPTPDLSASVDTKQMPKDVSDWLKWLEKIEKEKQALTAKEETEMSTLIATLQGAGGLDAAGVKDLTDPDSTTVSAPSMVSAQKITKTFIEAWSDLKKRFDSYPPPAECASIGEAYDNGLEGMAANGKKIMELLGGISGMDAPSQSDADTAIGSAKDVGRNHINDVDAELRKTDQLVQEICDKYDTRKWFSIDTKGSSGSLGMSGF